MAAKKQVGTGVAVTVIVIVVAIVALIIWRFTGVSKRTPEHTPGEMIAKYGAKMPGSPGGKPGAPSGGQATQPAPTNP